MVFGCYILLCFVSCLSWKSKTLTTESVPKILLDTSPIYEIPKSGTAGLLIGNFFIDADSDFMGVTETQ